MSRNIWIGTHIYPLQHCGLINIYYEEQDDRIRKELMMMVFWVTSEVKNEFHQLWSHFIQHIKKS